MCFLQGENYSGGSLFQFSLNTNLLFGLFFLFLFLIVSLLVQIDHNHFTPTLTEAQTFLSVQQHCVSQHYSLSSHALSPQQKNILLIRLPLRQNTTVGLVHRWPEVDVFGKGLPASA